MHGSGAKLATDPAVTRYRPRISNPVSSWLLFVANLHLARRPQSQRSQRILSESLPSKRSNRKKLIRLVSNSHYPQSVHVPRQEYRDAQSDAIVCKANLNSTVKVRLLMFSSLIEKYAGTRAHSITHMHT